MSRSGYRGGFNPFRKGGKFAAPNAADRSSDAGAAQAANDLGVANETIGATGKSDMNTAIRGAAGRGGGGGSGGDDHSGVSRLTGPTADRIRSLMQSAGMGSATTPDGFQTGNLNHVGTDLLSREIQNHGGKVRSESTEALRTAFQEAGYDTTTRVAPADLAQMMEDARTEHDRARAAAAALGMNKPLWALTAMEGSESAGFGWGETLEEMRGTQQSAPTSRPETPRRSRLSPDVNTPTSRSLAEQLKSLVPTYKSIADPLGSTSRVHGDALTGATFEILAQTVGRGGKVPPAARQAILASHKEANITPPARVTRSSMSSAYDAVEKAFQTAKSTGSWDGYHAARAAAVATALQAGKDSLAWQIASERPNGPNWRANGESIADQFAE